MLNPSQFEYPEDMATASSNEQHQFGRAHRAFGSGDPATVFGESQIATAPWPRGGKTKKGRDWDQDAVRDVLTSPPQLEDYDPRHLHATQPNIIRQHVQYYMGDSYKDTGRPSADVGNIGNKYPVVYHHPDGRHLLLSGHHRASAALLRGEPLQARPVRPS